MLPATTLLPTHSAQLTSSAPVVWPVEKRNMRRERASLTRDLNAAADGDPAARDEAFRALYDELRRAARARLRHQDRQLSLHSQDLVNELCLRFLTPSPQPRKWHNRGHFFAWASCVMQNIVIDHARNRSCQRRQGSGKRLVLDEVVEHVTSAVGDPLAFDEVMRNMQDVDPRMAAVVRYRFLLGCTVEETAAALDLSVRIVDRDTSKAKRFLWRKLR